MFWIPINQYQKADWALFIIYTDLECILEKIEACKIYPEDLLTAILSKDITSVFSMSAISSFKGIENKHDVYLS